MIRQIIYRFMETYFRHRWLYLLPLVIVVGVGAYYLVTTKPKYVARGNLYVQKESLLSSLNSVQSADASWWVSSAQAVNNEIVELLRTDAFVRAVIHRTDLEEKMSQGDEVVDETIEEIRESIWTMPMGDNQLQINSSYNDPVIAYQTVNSVIEGYIQWQVNGQRAESQAAQAFFAEQIQIYEEELESARQEFKNFLLTHPEPLQGRRSEIDQIEMARLQTKVTMAETRYVSALDKEENARLALAQIESDTRQSYTIIDAPTLPDEPEFSRRELAMQAAIFLAVGVILFITSVGGGTILDRSFRSEMDVVNGLNLTLLAMVPDVTVRKKWYQRLKWKRAVKAKPEDEKTTEESAANEPAGVSDLESPMVEEGGAVQQEQMASMDLNEEELDAQEVKLESDVPA